MIEGQETLTQVARLKYGMVGGGKGAFIGDVHRKAIAMDGKAELVAGLLFPVLEDDARHRRILGRRQKTGSTRPTRR